MLIHGNDPSRALGRVLTLALNISSQPIHVKGETHLNQNGLWAGPTNTYSLENKQWLGNAILQGEFQRESQTTRDCSSGSPVYIYRHRYVHIFIYLCIFYTFLCSMYVIMHSWTQRHWQTCRSSSCAPFQAFLSQQKQLFQMTGSSQHTLSFMLSPGRVTR